MNIYEASVQQNAVIIKRGPQPMEPSILSIPAADRIAAHQFCDWSRDEVVRRLKPKDTKNTDKWFDVRAQLQIYVSSLEDIMKMRIATGNRIVAMVYKDAGFAPGTKIYRDASAVDTVDDDVSAVNAETDEQDADNAQIRDTLKCLQDEYRRITDRIINACMTTNDINALKSAKIDPDTVVSIALTTSSTKKLRVILAASEDTKYLKTIVVYTMVKQYVLMLKQEKELEASLEELLMPFPIYRRYLRYIPGVGPKSASALLARIKIDDCNSAAALHCYCGLDVSPSGLGRSRRTEDLVPREYLDKDGAVKIRMSLTYSKYLQCKLLGVMAPVFMKTSPMYKDLYNNYKTRLLSEGRLNMYRQKMVGGVPVVDKQNEPALVKAYSASRIHKMAMRYMMKYFLTDLYINWCLIEGRTPKAPYEQAVLAHQGKFRMLVPSRVKKDDYDQVFVYFTEDALAAASKVYADMAALEAKQPSELEVRDDEFSLEMKTMIAELKQKRADKKLRRQQGIDEPVVAKPKTSKGSEDKIIIGPIKA